MRSRGSNTVLPDIITLTCGKALCAEVCVLWGVESGQLWAYFDESVELFVTTDGELQVTGCNTLHL